MSLIESQASSKAFSTSLRDFFTPPNSCFISYLKVEISDVRFPKCSCIWLSERESLSIICLNCSRLRASDCLLSSITVRLERRFLLADGVCCEDELDDLFSRSFLLVIWGCRIYRQILSSMFHYQDIRNNQPINQSVRKICHALMRINQSTSQCAAQSCSFTFTSSETMDFRGKACSKNNSSLERVDSRVQHRWRLRVMGS